MSTEPGFHEWVRTCPACNEHSLGPDYSCPRCGYDAAEEYEERKRQKMAEANEF